MNSKRYVYMLNNYFQQDDATSYTAETSTEIVKNLVEHMYKLPISSKSDFLLPENSNPRHLL